jgi:diguanylate cyclase (GGDEF)-like protein
MRDILELCVKMDQHAERLYEGLAESCSVQDLSETFDQLARDEAQHTGWWEGLLDAWEQGLVPDIVNDTEALAERLEGLESELSAVSTADLKELSPDEMLALAARIEFFMIDPVFGELIDLTEPGRAEGRHAAYQAHLQRLIDAIGRHYSPGSLAGLLASILSRAWKDNLRLAVFATHDTLTGIYNRRALYTHLPQWAAWSARYGHALAVLLIDVDFFKGVNDDYGHAAGDDALRAVAHALRKSVRASDLVVRFGGDEFAVIAPETDETEYADLTARIIETIHDLQVTDRTGRRIPISVSIGGVIAKDPPGSLTRATDRLLASADQSLYAAKNSGRDTAAPPILLGVGAEVV